MNHTVRPHRRTATATGLLILGGYLSYGIGSSITAAVTSTPGFVPSEGTSSTIAIGALLMLVNSGLVIVIGVTLYPVLKRYSSRIALGYVATRLFEGTLMAVGIGSILTLSAVGRGANDLESFGSILVANNLVAYNQAMVGLSVGSLFFCALLFRSGLVPRFLGAWGFIGYAIFAVGCVLELLGFAGAGLVATIPGGLWEVFFAGWLIVKGFTPVVAARPENAGLVRS